MIRIQNIYYMLAYAFRNLNLQGFGDFTSEEFEHTADLFSAILAKGIELIRKQGFYKAYNTVCEEYFSPKGKVELSESIRRNSFRKHQLTCSYDEFTMNSYPNQIVKTTLELLLHSGISKKQRKALNKLLPYFEGVKALNPGAIIWNKRGSISRNYQMLLGVCYLTIKGLLITEGDRLHLRKYLDDQSMCRLYEKFVLEYYRKEFPLLKAAPRRINWRIDTGSSNLLPVMQTDIMLTWQDRTLILDTKYYSETMQFRREYDSRTLHSQNLYQIFTYVKNQDTGDGKVAGALLYAKTDETLTPDCEFMMDGNRIRVKTLDLSLSFPEIASQLNQLVISEFGRSILPGG